MTKDNKEIQLRKALRMLCSGKLRELSTLNQQTRRNLQLAETELKIAEEELPLEKRTQRHFLDQLKEILEEDRQEREFFWWLPPLQVVGGTFYLKNPEQDLAEDAVKKQYLLDLKNEIHLFSMQNIKERSQIQRTSRGVEKSADNLMSYFHQAYKKVDRNKAEQATYELLGFWKNLGSPERNQAVHEAKVLSALAQYHYEADIPSIQPVSTLGYEAGDFLKRQKKYFPILYTFFQSSIPSKS